MAARGRKGGVILIVLALVVILGIVAIYFLVIRGLPGLDQQTGVQTTDLPLEQQVSMGQIVVSAQNISRGGELTEEVLVTIPYPQEEIATGMFYTDIADVEGLRAKDNIPARVPLTESMLVGEENVLAENPSFEIPAGFTAASMPMSSLTSVSYGVQQGDHVMVIGCLQLVDLDTDFQTTTPNGVAPVIAPYTPPEGPTTTTITVQGAEGGSPPRGRVEMDTGLGLPVYVIPGETAQRPRLVCQTMIPDAVVLGVGLFPSAEEVEAEKQLAAQAQAAAAAPDPAAPVAENQPTEVVVEEDKERESEVALVMSPQDAVTLNYMILSGVKLSMALRNPTDTDSVTTQAVTLQYMMDQKVIPLPAKLPYGMEPSVDVLYFPSESVPAAEQAE